MEVVDTKSGIRLAIVSLIAFYLSLAMFTPAILVTYFMVFVTGIYAWQKYYTTAAVLFLINATALYFHIDLVMRSGYALNY